MKMLASETEYVQLHKHKFQDDKYGKMEKIIIYAST